MSYKMIHVPEDNEPSIKGETHSCGLSNTIDRNRRSITVKHRSIAKCDDCGQYWWAKVYGRYNSYSGHNLYHLEWYRVYWYHFRLKKYTR